MSAFIKVAQGDYGPVQLIAGPRKGRIGIYDDEDEDDNGETMAIVHFGHVILPSDFELIPFEFLSSALTTHKLIARMNEISRELWEKREDIYFQNDRLHELHLCSELLMNRYMNAKERMKIKEKRNIFI